MEAAIGKLVETLDPQTIAGVPTSRGLVALVDARFQREARAHRWYAIVGRGDHIYAVADIDGRRVTLQRFIMKLQIPGASFDDIKHVGFRNKISFDCRTSNLEDRVGRQAVMRNRRPKKNTSSRFKGVIKWLAPDGSVRWRTQIKGDDGSMGIGVYDDEVWAATVYDAAASLLFERAALYNLPEQPINPQALEIAAAKIEAARKRRADPERAHRKRKGRGKQADTDAEAAF